MNATVVMSLIAALAAIVAPIATAYINSQAKIKLKKISILNKRSAAYEDFSGKFSILFQSNVTISQEEFSALLSVTYRVMPLCDEDSLELLIELSEYLKYKPAQCLQNGLMQDSFFRCVKSLSRDLRGQIVENNHNRYES